MVLEGIDGAGKTDLADRLTPPLLHRGHSVSRFREPTDVFLRNQATRILSSDPIGAAFCFTVDRVMLRPEVARSLAQGDVVVQDRSFYSNLAYQAPRLDKETWKELDRIERTVALEPDVVLYLDVPVEVAVRRVRGRGKHDAFEEEAYLGAVREKFEELFVAPQWVRLDASGSPEATLTQAMDALIATGL